MLLRTSRNVAGAVALVALPIAATPAHAQMVGDAPPEPAIDTGPYAPIGLRSGPIYFFPSLEVLGIYNDNVYAQQNNKRGDELLVVSPQLHVLTDWSRHQLELLAEGEFGFYNDFTTENYQDYRFKGRFRLDVTRATNILFEASRSRDHQQRGDPETVAGLEPTKFDVTRGKVQLNQSLGRLQLSGGASIQRLEFKDVAAVGGGFINNHDRNRNVFVADGKAAYEFSPGYSVYTEFAYNWRNFDDRVDDLGVNRDSHGFEFTGGVDFELTDLLVGSVYGGYMEQHPDDPSLVKIKGPAFGADLTWSATPLTTVTLSGSRTIQDSQYLNASGFFADRGRLTVKYDFRDNITLRVYGEIGQDAYRGITRNDFRYGAGISMQWQMNHYLAADVGYTFQGRNTNYTGIQDFNRNLIAVGLTAKY
ncbi:MAG: outer membrane beta-barrel protein [Alphaproteobacteria bacterium]|nr:outer membrane beta-barrel protein [Alphaproteobacteria bacterium]